MAFPNGLFGSLKRPVLKRETARLAMQDGWQPYPDAFCNKKSMAVMAFRKVGVRILLAAGGRWRRVFVHFPACLWSAVVQGLCVFCHCA